MAFDFSFSGGDLFSLAGDIGSALIGSQTASRAAEQQAQGFQQAQQISDVAKRQARQDVTATIEPSIQDIIGGVQGGIGVLQGRGPGAEMEAALAGVLGPEAQQQAIDSFIQSPGQKFLRDEQEQSILRNQAAIGGLGGGRVRTALQEAALGRAGQFQQSQLENFRNIGQREEQTQANISNILTGGGVDLANLRTGIGSNLANIGFGFSAQQAPIASNIGVARSAGALGQGSAFQQGLQNVSGTLGTIFS